MIIRCLGCKRTLNNPNWNPKDICSFCKSNFVPIQQSRQGNLGTQFEEIGNTFSGINIPHIIIGNEGITTNKQIPRKNYQNNQMNYQNNQNQNYQETWVDKYADKIKQWALYVCISLVVGYAVWRIFF